MVVPGHQKSRGYHATLDSFVIYGHCRSSMLTGGANPACGMPFPVTRKNRWHCNATCRSNAPNYR